MNPFAAAKENISRPDMSIDFMLMDSPEKAGLTAVNLSRKGVMVPGVTRARSLLLDCKEAAQEASIRFTNPDFFDKVLKDLDGAEKAGVDVTTTLFVKTDITTHRECYLAIFVGSYGPGSIQLLIDKEPIGSYHIFQFDMDVKLA